MSTNIYQFNGNLLVSVSDGTLNTSAAPIQIPGKGYTNYGAPVMQDILWTMQNFAGTSAPTPLLQGVMWYDTNSGYLKIYDSGWHTTFKDNQSLIPSADLTYTVGSASYRYATIYAGTINASNVTGDTTLMHTNTTNLPTVDNTYNLGSASYKYANIYATTFNGVATSAQYADVAERYASDENMEPGDVVKIGGEKEITKTTAAADIDVFGVISDKPALKMNDKAGSDATHPLVALLGRTPVKIVGPIGKGQRVVSSDIAGVAKAADGDEPDLAIIGRALHAKQSDEIELVEIVIGRN